VGFNDSFATVSGSFPGASSMDSLCNTLFLHSRDLFLDVLEVPSSDLRTLNSDWLPDPSPSSDSVSSPSLLAPPSAPLAPSAPSFSAVSDLPNPRLLDSSSSDPITPSGRDLPSITLSTSPPDPPPSPSTEYKHLRNDLTTLGFTMDDKDCCLFTMKCCVFVVYVDDAIIVAKDKSVRDTFLTQLSDAGLDIE
jgi:hypothetical protein